MVDAALGHSAEIGRSVPPADLDAKLLGQFAFLSDLLLPDAAWAHVVRSPFPHATLLRLDTKAALNAPGVLAIFRAEDVPQGVFNPAGAAMSAQLQETADKRLLTRSACHIGDAVAVVVAQSRALAAGAAALLDLRWRELPFVPQAERARGSSAGALRLEMEGGEVDGVQGVSLKICESFRVRPVQHMCLETHACAASIDAASGGLRIYSNTQAPAAVREKCAAILDLDMGLITVQKVQEGGGFGCKQEVYEEPLVAWLCQALGRTVQLTYTREEEFSATRVRGGVEADIFLGVTELGRISHVEMDAIYDAGAYLSHAPYVLANILGASQMLYPDAAVRANGIIVKTNRTPSGAYRGYGVTEALFGLEQCVDIAAQRLGIHPIELRRRNRSAVDTALTPDPLSRCLERATARWERLSDRSRWPDDGRLRGVGVAMASVVSTVGDPAEDATRAVLVADHVGCLTLISGTCDCGTGSTTALVAIVAQELGVPRQNVRVQEGDSSLGSVDAGSYSQRSVYVGGQAALLAARAMRRRLAELVPTPPGQAAPFTRAQIASLVENSGAGELRVEVTYIPTAQPASSCVCVVRVSIDQRTGVVVVEEVAAVVDCGTVINRLTARGQVLGAVGQGISSTLLEEFEVGEDGSVPTTFRQHGVMRAGDLPRVDVFFIDQAAETGPFGAKGVGETALPPVPAAIANAVAAATGRRVWKLPITSRAVWEAITHV